MGEEGITSDGAGEAHHELDVDVVGRTARGILQNAETIDDDVEAPKRFAERSLVEIGERQLLRRHAMGRHLRRREPSGQSHNVAAKLLQLDNHGVTDESRGSKDADARVRFRHRYMVGFAIISHRISATEPKPGNPNRNQSRKMR